MLRILRRTSSILCLEAPTIPSCGVIGNLPVLPSSSSSSTIQNGNLRLFSSVTCANSGSCRISPLSWKPETSLLSCKVTPVIYEQNRSYWRKEGRIGWRRLRRKSMEHREKILYPSSPVIDQRQPWPKDDLESLPHDLFPEDRDDLSPEEIKGRQNAILSTINSQMSSKTEGRLFAVVHVNGKQFKVTPEDIIIVQNYFPPIVGEQIRLHKVLLVGSKDFTLIGCPLLDNELVRVEATVIEKTLSYTKLHFKMVKRENYRRLKFLKTPYSMLRINLIQLMQPLNMIEKSDFEESAVAAATQQHQSTITV